MKTAIVLGSATGWLDEERAAREMFTPDIVIACNHAAKDYPGTVDYWCSLHSALIPKWIDERRAKGLPDARHYVQSQAQPKIDVPNLLTVKSEGGSSGLLCVVTALQIPCARVVCCGVPLEADRAHFDDKPPRAGDRAARWTDASNYHAAWMAMKKQRRLENVRSMSGWTAQLLGVPTREWLEAANV